MMILLIFKAALAMVPLLYLSITALLLFEKDNWGPLSPDEWLKRWVDLFLWPIDLAVDLWKRLWR